MKFATEQAEGFVRLVAGQDPFMKEEDFKEGVVGQDRYRVDFGFAPNEKKVYMSVSLNKGHREWVRPPLNESDAEKLASIMGQIPVLLLAGDLNIGAYTSDGYALSMFRAPEDQCSWVITCQPQGLKAEDGMRKPGRWISCIDGLTPKQVFATLKL